MFIFAKHLSGELDVVWKYLNLVKRLLTHLEPIDEMGKYRQFLQICYPGRTVCAISGCVCVIERMSE